jgi:hypothetical protein
MNTQRTNLPPVLDSKPDPKIPVAAAIEFDTARDNGRDPDRDDEYIRLTPTEPSEKYELDPREREPGMDYIWASVRVPYSTLKNRRLNDYQRGGWKFCRAADHPSKSGYKPGHMVNKRFIELGIEDEVQADDPVFNDNLVLMKRPKALSQQAERERDTAAASQINDHLRRQREKSEREIGRQYTQMRRQYGPADEAPPDAAEAF